MYAVRSEVPERDAAGRVTKRMSTDLIDLKYQKAETSGLTVVDGKTKTPDIGVKHAAKKSSARKQK
jgi:hypothetical protein